MGVFGIPCIGRYHDYGLLPPAELVGEALALAKRVCAVLGGYRRWSEMPGRRNRHFRRVERSRPSRPNDFTLTTPLTPEKSPKWERTIGDIVRSRSASHSSLECIIGRVEFAACAVFSRFARCMLQPLYGKLYSASYYNYIHGKTTDTTKWRAGSLTTPLPAGLYAAGSRVPLRLSTQKIRSETIQWRSARCLSTTAPNRHPSMSIDTLL